MSERWWGIVLALAMAGGLARAGREKVQQASPSPLDEYLQQVLGQNLETGRSPGSIYTDQGVLADLGRDLRAARVGDLVTIIVSDRASAVSRGSTNFSRKASSKASINSLLGPRSSGIFSNLANLGGASELQGEGQTSRESTLATTISARVTHVLPNGNLVLEGSKDIWVNSERQRVTVRGVARWHDLGPFNTVRSDRLAFLEVRVEGKGVVGDAVRRPGLLYRILLGLLPF